MKSDKLQNAIGMIDADLVTRAEKTKKSKTKRIIKWTTPIAAVLAIAICVGIFFGNGSPFVPNVYAIAEATYPEMAKYTDDYTDREAIALWRESQAKQKEYRGAGENLSGFIAKTMVELLSGAGDENLTYSPLNIYMALAMLAETTGGSTREEILNLLDVESIEALRTQAHAIWNANYNNDGSNYTSILGSSFWMNDTVDYKDEVLKILAENYYASSFSGEMGSSDYNKALQNWMNEQTRGLLKDQIDHIEMRAETVLALVTTIYFEDQWADAFDKKKNTEDIFHAATGDQTVTFMNERMLESYYWGENFTATRKDLRGSGFMYFILPDEDSSISELLADEEALSFLTTCSSKEISKYENAKSMYVNLSLPKFDIESQLDLIEPLKNLGVTECFEFGADFTPTYQDETLPVAVTKVQHGARVMIDEESVFAAAYTFIEEAAGSAISPTLDEVDFIADRPFIFVITGNDNLPLFVGIVNQI